MSRHFLPLKNICIQCGRERGVAFINGSGLPNSDSFVTITGYNWILLWPDSQELLMIPQLLSTECGHLIISGTTEGIRNIQRQFSIQLMGCLASILNEIKKCKDTGEDKLEVIGSICLRPELFLREQ